jgi:hypothetical protein
MKSWETTVPGLAGMVLGMLLCWMAILYDNDLLLGFGITAISGGLGALGLVARSQAEHERDRQQRKT